MDYEFRRDPVNQVIAIFSMGHEAIGHWLSEEVKGNLALLDEIEQMAEKLRGSEQQWCRQGHEYTLWMGGGEVTVRANQLDFVFADQRSGIMDDEELIDEEDIIDDTAVINGIENAEGTSYYDQENEAICGMEDFLQAVRAYRHFALFDE